MSFSGPQNASSALRVSEGDHRLRLPRPHERTRFFGCLTPDRAHRKVDGSRRSALAAISGRTFPRTQPSREYLGISLAWGRCLIPHGQGYFVCFSPGSLAGCAAASGTTLDEGFLAPVEHHRSLLCVPWPCTKQPYRLRFFMCWGIAIKLWGCVPRCRLFGAFRTRLRPRSHVLLSTVPR